MDRVRVTYVIYRGDERESDENAFEAVEDARRWVAGLREDGWEVSAWLTADPSTYL